MLLVLNQVLVIVVLKAIVVWVSLIILWILCCRLGQIITSAVRQVHCPGHYWVDYYCLFEIARVGHSSVKGQIVQVLYDRLVAHCFAQIYQVLVKNGIILWILCLSWVR